MKAVLPDILPTGGMLRDFAFSAAGAGAAVAVVRSINFLRQRQLAKELARERGSPSLPETSTLNKGSKKESVEWVNMVFLKIWKIYRKGLEDWLIGLLQPAIDKLPKPDYVTRVEIAELSLDYEPISVRDVQRRTSRRTNDLQYHIGLRYTGGARCLILLHLNKGGMNVTVPVRVRDLDVDGELWVKLRLAPVKPFVGTLSVAFVRLPTIKLVLSPFRLVNLFAVPFLSSFLSNLLTVDLPKLIVLPRHITFDFLPYKEDEALASSLLVQILGNGSPGALAAAPAGTLDAAGPPVGWPMMHGEPGEAYVGELTVTLCGARGLSSWGLAALSNPYCTLSVGNQFVESKRNRATSHPSGPREPVWNQDFRFWVEDPLNQKLTVTVCDSSLTLKPVIGSCQASIWELQDCVPVSLWCQLSRDTVFGPREVPGEVCLLLTYKSFVDKEYDLDPEVLQPPVPYIKVFGLDDERDGSRDSSSSDGNSSTADRRSDVYTSHEFAESVAGREEGAPPSVERSLQLLQTGSQTIKEAIVQAWDFLTSFADGSLLQEAAASDSEGEESDGSKLQLAGSRAAERGAGSSVETDSGMQHLWSRSPGAMEEGSTRQLCGRSPVFGDGGPPTYIGSKELERSATGNIPSASSPYGGSGEQEAVVADKQPGGIAVSQASSDVSHLGMGEQESYGAGPYGSEACTEYTEDPEAFLSAPVEGRSQSLEGTFGSIHVSNEGEEACAYSSGEEGEEEDSAFDVVVPVRVRPGSQEEAAKDGVISQLLSFLK